MGETITEPRREFLWTGEKDPHASRRAEILQDHPEVAELFKPDPRIVFVVIPLVLFQLGIALYVHSLHWAVYIAIAYFIGSTIAHALFLAIHEITHDLAFRKPAYNNILAIFANLPLVIPYAMHFRRYHAMHHWRLGRDGVDTDIPSRLEARLFKGKVGKSIWLCLQLIFYAVRPMATKSLRPNIWIIMSIAVQFSFLAVFVWYVGWAGFGYLVLSIFLAGGLNPLAGHFVAEHYEFVPGQETYSYYGPANYLAFNVGYHVEHHDFPNIPGSRLPYLNKIAKEYYEPLYCHKSWFNAISDFLFNERITLFSRAKRKA